MTNPTKCQVNISLDRALFDKLENHRFALIKKHKRDFSRSGFFESIFLNFFEKLTKDTFSDKHNSIN